MAEIIPDPVAAADDNQQDGRGGRMKFSTNEDKILVCEVFAAKARFAR